jgi:hypothetical protein
VSVVVKESVKIPEALLQHPPSRYSLVSKPKQEELSGIINFHSNIGETAFKYWLAVLRWKSRIGHIGEPGIRYAGQKRSGSVLRSRDTGHPFWLPMQVIMAQRHELVTVEHWQAAQAALSKEKTPPVWIDFLFDSEQRLNNLDNVGATLSLAIALEVSVRMLATHHLDHQHKIESVIREIIDITNLRAILNRLTKLSFWDKHWKRITQFADFNKLMNARDQIMHAANTKTLDTGELRRIYTSVHNFGYCVAEYLESLDA